MSLHSVPDQDWVKQAKAKHASVVALANLDNEVAHSEEDELREILVHAVLAGAPATVLHDVATICASTVFIQYERWYA